MSLFKLTFIFYLVFLGLFTFPRLLSSKIFCTRGLECASINRLPTSPFEPQFESHFSQICGDLAKMGNLPERCVFREETFITDQWGYRNTQHVFDQKADILLFGDSFAFGEGNTQEHIPSVQLSKTLNAHVYNGAGKIELEYLNDLILRLQEKPKAVLYFHLERHVKHPNEVLSFNKIIKNSLSEEVKLKWENIKNFNPLEILLTKFEKSIVTKVFIPNRFESNVSMFTLQNNEPFIFLPSSVERFYNSRTQQTTNDAAFFVKLKEALSIHKITLHVVLIPEKMSVYGYFINGHQKIYPVVPYLDLLHKELINNKVHSIHLLPKFRLKAEMLLRKNKYIYWPDDTHWNPEGIKLATEIIKDNLADY